VPEVTTLQVVTTVIVLLAIAVAILLFERRRAEEIKRDLTEQTRRRRDAGSDRDGDSRR